MQNGKSAENWARGNGSRGAEGDGYTGDIEF